jgi:anti-sigma regulatory factor (Ser/Thr protein kinase)
MPARPRHSALTLEAAPRAVPCARRHTRLVLADWGLAHLAETAELIASELVTNAVTAAKATHPTRPIRLWLASGGYRLVLLVGDPSPYPPQRINPGTGTEGGRGLLLVEALSATWGWYPTGQPETAKIVWVELRHARADQENAATGQATPATTPPHRLVPDHPSHTRGGPS